MTDKNSDDDDDDMGDSYPFLSNKTAVMLLLLIQSCFHPYCTFLYAYDIRKKERIEELFYHFCLLVILLIRGNSSIQFMR